MAGYRRYLRRVVELRMDPELRLRVDPSDVVQETQLLASERIDDFLSRRRFVSVVVARYGAGAIDHPASPTCRGRKTFGQARS